MNDLAVKSYLNCSNSMQEVSDKAIRLTDDQSRRDRWLTLVLIAIAGFEYVRFHDAMRRMDKGHRSKKLIDTLGLGDAIHRSIDQYSRGMKPKIQLVAALSHEPGSAHGNT